MNRQYMILSIFLLLLLQGSWTALSAQELVLHSTPAGIYIEVVGGPETEGWTVQRLRNRQAPERSYSLVPGTDRSAYQQGLRVFNRLFPDGATLPMQMADSLWRRHEQQQTVTHPAYLLARGRAVVDSTVAESGNYEYQLINARNQVVARQRIVHPQPVRLPQLRAAVNPPTQRAELQWYTKNAEELWSAVVFRQDPVTSAFERIRPQVLAFRHPDVPDSVSVFVRDTALTQPGYWRYYIEPVDRFGNRGRTAEVGHVLVLDEESRPHFSVLQTESLTEKSAIRLSWTGDRNPRLQAIRVYRSRTYGGTYELRATLPAEATTFEDAVPIAREPFFYYLETEELSGRTIRSAIVSDYYNGSVLPIPPHSVTAEVTDQGVEIRWEGDQGRNYGYVVYRSTSATGEMIAVSPFLRAQQQAWRYLDTSRQLQAGQVYSYAIRAISPTDESSELSERVFATAPGERFLAAPRDLRARLNGDRIIVSWEDLSAREAGVVGYHLYRKSSSEEEFQRINPSPLGLYDNRYVDEVPLSISSYTYAVRAIDVNGVESGFSVERTVPIHRQVDLRPEVVEGAQTDNSNVVVWSSLPYPAQAQSVRLYRAEEGGPFVQIGQFSPEQVRYDDQQINPSRDYRYQLVVIDQEGNASAPTQVLTMRR